MSKAAILVTLAQAYHTRQTVGPFDQLLAMLGRSRKQLVQRTRGADESVARANGLRQLRVKQAFAHAEG